MVRPGFDLPHGSPMLNQLSQPVGDKLSWNQIDKVVNSMYQGLATLNGLIGDEMVTFEDIKDPCGELYHQLNFSNDTDNVPADIKKNIFERQV